MKRTSEQAERKVRKGSVVRASIAGTATRRGYLGRNQTGASSRLGSAAKAGTAAAGAATLTLALNGTNIGTVAFAAGKAVATFTTTGGNPYLLNVGDVLTLTAPATQDAALADLVGYVAVQ